MKAFSACFRALLSCLTITAFNFAFGASEPKVIEAEKIVLKNKHGKVQIVLDGSGEDAKISMYDSRGVSRIEISGGHTPVIAMKNQDQVDMVHISLLEERSPLVSLKDELGVSRVQMQGGATPAFFLKNQTNEIIGTMLPLQEGGAALGLADKDGDVSAFVRGGSTPSVSFFQKSTEPNVAVGISKGIPHILLSSPKTSDNVVMHGGDPTSILFIDSKGEIPVLLSKHGLFQGKKKSSQKNEPQKEEIFTWDELKETLEEFKITR